MSATKNIAIKTKEIKQAVLGACARHFADSSANYKATDIIWSTDLGLYYCPPLWESDRLAAEFMVLSGFVQFEASRRLVAMSL